MGSEAEKLRQRIMSAGNPSGLTLSDSSVKDMIDGENRVFPGLTKKEIQSERNRRKKLEKLQIPENSSDLQPKI